jgi:sugar phosphate isomerase/epimerase
MFGCVEFCVPGKTLEEKLKTIEKHKLWLELVNSEKRDLSILDSFDVEINSVQAYLLHDLSLLSKDPIIQGAAAAHVRDTIRLASRVNAKNVITVPTYGYSYVKDPFKKCVNIFRDLSAYATEFDIEILIEVLGLRKTAFLPSLTKVHRLVKEIDRENVGLMADTCHIYESKEEVIQTLYNFKDEIIELHLRDTESRPPGKGKLNFEKILNICKASFLCLEYKSKNLKKDFEDVLSYLLTFSTS